MNEIHFIEWKLLACALIITLDSLWVDIRRNVRKTSFLTSMKRSQLLEAFKASIVSSE